MSECASHLVLLPSSNEVEYAGHAGPESSWDRNVFQDFVHTYIHLMYIYIYIYIYAPIILNLCGSLCLSLSVDVYVYMHLFDI